MPFKQACRLPIILYKPKLLKLKGRVVIESSNISTGMILLGFPKVSIFPNSGIVFENHGGNCVFYGSCSIGNASAISIGKTGNLYFGERFNATACAKIVSYYSLEFKDNVSLGWDNVVTDTDFHKMTKIDGGYTKGYGKVVIGRYNWFGLRCTILKNTDTPDFCTIGGNSVLNKKYDFPPYSVLAGNPCDKRGEGVYLNNRDDKIDYSC